MGPRPDSSLPAVIAAIGGNATVTAAKFAGWFISLSPSMLAEAVHSLADTLNQVLLWVGIRHGAGKPTAAYPFGKGRARYIWNLVSAMGIFFVGFGFTTYHGVSTLIAANEDDPINRSWVPLIILVFSAVVESYTLVVAIKSVNTARGEKTLLGIRPPRRRPDGCRRSPRRRNRRPRRHHGLFRSASFALSR